MADKSPAFQWYPKDFMTDAAVIVMTLAQEGAYRRLMDTCWLEHGLPTDPALLWRLAKADSRDHFERELWPSMSMKFLERDGKLHHTRLDGERSKQRKHRKVRQLAAKNRWDKQRARDHANALQLQCSSSASSSASATPVKKKDPAAGADGFAEFWLSYPRKDNRKDALKAWNALKPDAALRPTILADVKRRIASEPWRKDKGAFIPYGGSYLRSHRWEDEGVKSWSASTRSDAAPCEWCGHPEPRFHSQTECHQREIANRNLNRPATAETA